MTGFPTSCIGLIVQSHYDDLDGFRLKVAVVLARAVLIIGKNLRTTDIYLIAEYDVIDWYDVPSLSAVFVIRLFDPELKIAVPRIREVSEMFA